MRGRPILLAAGLSAGWLVGCATDRDPVSPRAGDGLAPASKPSAEAMPDRYIVVLADGVADVTGTAAALARLHGTVPDHVYRHALAGFSASMSARAAADLARDPRVAYVEPDHIAHAVAPGGGKPKPPGGGGEGPAPQVVPWGVDRVCGADPARADETCGSYGGGGTAWVIDTGIDLDHGDLNVDVARSANFVPRGRNSPDDGNGHGTHVAGTIGAIDNAQDVVGVAAGAALVAVRVLDSSGSGAYSWVIAGVDYVAARAAAGDVANMSLGGPVSEALDAAVRGAADRGVQFALAAGNDGADANDSSPARVEHANARTVSAIGQDDCLPSWSNWGNPPVDVAAPGVGILSTKKGGGTAVLNGTSMAAPHVAGLLLLGLASDGFACGDRDGNPDPIAHR